MRELTANIIGAAIEVHTALGPGLLESTYEECMAREMQLRELRFERQVPLPVAYKGVQLDCGYRLDFVVDRTVVLELKAVDTLRPIHEAQLLTYLRLGGWTVGLLINFNVPVLRNGIRRVVLNHKDLSAPSAPPR
jgi:GxxExxY protein